MTKISGQVDVALQADAPDGACVTASFGDETESAEVKAGAPALTLHYAEPNLWSPDDPYLYEGTLTLTCGGRPTKSAPISVSARFLRATWMASDTSGFCSTASPSTSMAPWIRPLTPKGTLPIPPRRTFYQEAWRLKRLGLNMARIHIKSEEPRKLYWMDKLGVLIMADIPCFWGAPEDEARTAYEQALPELMGRDINHPSIFA